MILHGCRVVIKAGFGSVVMWIRRGISLPPLCGGEVLSHDDVSLVGGLSFPVFGECIAPRTKTSPVSSNSGPEILVDVVRVVLVSICL